MSDIYRIKHINAALSKECLAERLHIYTDWPALVAGEVKGEASFENAWYLVDRATGQIIAKDSVPAPPLNISIADAMSFSIALPEPTSTITGEHVMAYLKAMHATEMERVLAPIAPPDEQP